MTTTPDGPLSDDMMSTSDLGEAVGAPTDADGTDGHDTDGTDSAYADGTDSADADGADADGADGHDADGTDA